MFEDNVDNYLELLALVEEEKKHNYPLPLVVSSVEGDYLIDKNGKRYLDFTSCKDNHPLGYSKGNIEITNAFFDSELFISADADNLEKQLHYHTGLERAYFTSSKLENYEILNHIVKSYLNSKNQNKILISATYINQDNFVSNDVDINLIPLNKDTIAKSVFTKDVGAVIVELVQVNDEILIAESDYLKYLRNLCDKNDAILIFDASSIAPLRLLKGLFNYDNSIKPDILLISKGMSQGIPFGGVLVSEKVDKDHKSLKTGTSILAYKQVLKLLDDYGKNDFDNIVKSNAKYFEKSLNDIAQTHISIVDIESYGMLFTLKLDILANEVVKSCFEQGIIIEAINDRTIKISPPYFMGKEEIDKLVNALDSSLDKLARFDRLR